jgi:hypothetical protein
MRPQVEMRVTPARRAMIKRQFEVQNLIGNGMHHHNRMSLSLVGCDDAKLAGGRD